MVVLYQLTAYFYQVLSPLQRYQSMRRLDNSPAHDTTTSKWFVLLGLTAIGLLLILLFVVRRMRRKNRLDMEALFRETCQKHKLTSQECEILSSICQHAKLEIKNQIFTDYTALETGFTGLIQESFSAGHSLRQRKQLNVMVQCIKAKLGFQKTTHPGDGAVLSPRKMGSRQIPQGRNVRVEVVSESSVFCFEAQVIRNDSFELVLQPETAITAIQQMTNLVARLRESNKAKAPAARHGQRKCV